MAARGGMIGLPEYDFYKRQKSGDWTIDEHFQDVNYIRSKNFTPNNYLLVGTYETDEALVYDIFNNEVSSLTKPITGIDAPSITCSAYNKIVEHLAIGLNKSPYLRVFDVSVNDFTDFTLSNLYLDNLGLAPNPVFVKRFRQKDFDDNVLRIVHNLNDPMPAVFMLCDGPNISYPYEIKLLDENTVDITFETYPVTLSGIVYIHSCVGNTTHLLSTLSQTIVDNYKIYQLNITDYNHENPIFQIYNSVNVLIMPVYIREVVINKIYELAFPSDFDPIDSHILVAQGFETTIKTFEASVDQNIVSVNHFLHSKYLSFQIFDEYGFICYPSNINMTDKDNFVITFDEFLRTGTYKIYVSKAPPNYAIPEFIVGEPPSTMVTSLEFDSYGDSLFVGTLGLDVRNSNLLEFTTKDYIRSVSIDPLPAVITTIKVDQDSKYLFLGHYSNTTVNRNKTLYNYETKELITDYNFVNLKSLTTDSVPSSCFAEQYRLLLIGSYYSPYIYFYNYIESEDITYKYIDLISEYVTSRPTNIVNTSCNRYAVISLDRSPYLVIIDFLNNTINKLQSTQINSSITSISLSINDRYLCVTQREEPKILVFEFSPTSISPVNINYIPEKTPITSIFFFGPISSDA